MQKRRLAVDAEAAQRAGEAAAAHLSATPEYQRCRRIVAYAPLAGEFPLGPAIERARADGKDVLWPRVRGDGALEFAPSAHFEDLIPGRYGVPEPPASSPAASLGSDVLLLLPGLAFDEGGGRLGRGAGAWDRALARAEAAFACGVGYEFQVVKEVPREAHDRMVAALLTECGVRRCRAR